MSASEPRPPEAPTGKVPHRLEGISHLRHAGLYVASCTCGKMLPFKETRAAAEASFTRHRAALVKKEY